MSLRRVILIAASAAIVLAAGWFTYGLVHEAYGEGPPYYGQTANMDKWSSPWPVIAVVNGLALPVALALGLLAVRARPRR